MTVNSTIGTHKLINNWHQKELLLTISWVKPRPKLHLETIQIFFQDSALLVDQTSPLLADQDLILTSRARLVHNLVGVKRERLNSGMMEVRLKNKLHLMTVNSTIGTHKLINNWHQKELLLTISWVKPRPKLHLEAMQIFFQGSPLLGDQISPLLADQDLSLTSRARLVHNSVDARSNN